MPPDLLRCVIIRPYIRGQGPEFVLSIFDLHDYNTTRSSRAGASLVEKAILGYRLIQRTGPGKAQILFQGSDFACSPLHAADSDAAVAAILEFLTLRPGDTDAEYFEHYTQAQLAFCENHADYVGNCFPR